MGGKTVTRKRLIILGIGIILLAVSFKPIFLMMREHWIGISITNRYDIDHADQKDGFPRILQTPKIIVNNDVIEIIEEKTGLTAPLTVHDKGENLPSGEIVKLQIKLNGKNVAASTEMWLSNRDRGSRYFSWLDILTIKDNKTGENHVAIVQRLTGDNEPTSKRKWRILYINKDRQTKVETFEYRERSQHQLGVRLVNFSGTSLISMGYNSDILHYYPSFVFPVFYPWITTILGFIFLLLFTIATFQNTKKDSTKIRE
jgi:hypothetical protein